MNRMRESIVALLALAVVMTTLSGCGRRGLIRINGEKISKQEFYDRLEDVQVPIGPGQQTTAGRLVVQQMIGEKLWEELAKEQKVTPTEEQVNKKIEAMKKQYGADFRKVLAQQGVTIDELKKKLMTNQAMVNVIIKDISIPDSAVKQEYDKALKVANSSLIRPPGSKISAIMVGSKAKADKAYSVLNGGADFGSVALKYTEDPLGKQSQGVIGWVTKSMEAVPKSVRDAAFGLAVGKYTKPFQLGPKTWIIVKVEQRRPEKITSYDDVKDAIREQLAMREGYRKNKVAETMSKFTKKADIVINAQAYKDIGESIKKDAAKALEVASKANAGTAGTAGTPAVQP